MSAPATNALVPAPVRIAPAIAGSLAGCTATWPSSAMTVAFRALSLSGRLMVTRAMRSLTENERVVYMAAPGWELEGNVASHFRFRPGSMCCRYLSP